MADGNLNSGKAEDEGGNSSKESRGDSKSSASFVAVPRAMSRLGKSNRETSLKRRTSPSSQSMPKRVNARSYQAWLKNLRKKSNMTDNSPSKSITYHAHNDKPVHHIVNQGQRTEGIEEDFAARRLCNRESTTSLDGREELRNTEGNRDSFRYCNGKRCEASYELSCLDGRNQGSRTQHDQMVPQRLLQRRALISSLEHDKDAHGMSNCQHEWLVKWRGLGYEHATWELENSQFLCCPDGQSLIQNYYTRHKKGPGEKCPSTKLSQLPGGCSSELDKYIHVVKKLHRYKDQNAIIFDDKARIMKIISFIRSFSLDTCQPFLIISTSTNLQSWEEGFLSLEKSVDVVVYSENREIREHIRKLEFYKENGCIMFQVLLTSPEVVIEDLEVLACIGWEVIVVDKCQCCRVASCLEQLKRLHTGMRLLVASGQLKGGVAEYINILSFLDSYGDSISSVNLPPNSNSIISNLKEKLAKYVAYDSETKSSRFVEYWIPAVISNVQLEQYCHTLLRNSLFLCSSSKSDPVGALGNLLIALQKCCDHPYVANLSIQTLLTEDRKEKYLDIGIKASGKLILLDAMLSEMKKQGLKVLVLFQVIGDGPGRDLLGDILDDLLWKRFGPDSYGRIDIAIDPSEKKSALDKFNTEQGRFVLLLEKHACLPSIKLLSLDAIILFNSDWNPMNDIRALQKITFDKQIEQVNLFRLYSTCTMEEKILILSTKGKPLEGNVQNIGPNTGRILLMWGASYLFTKLDEFHSPTVDTIEKPHLENVLREFLKILAQKTETDESISLSTILQVKLDSGTYCTNNTLFGERKKQLKDEDLPHMFWAKLLEGRHTQFKFSADLTPKKRKRVQYSDELEDNPNSEGGEAENKLRKVSSINVQQDFLEGLQEGIFAKDKGDDTVMVPEGRKLHDSQQSLCICLKPELAQLCEVLHLPEDVKIMAGRFLEYVINNHHVSRDSFTLGDAYQNSNCMDTESETWWQAFQISLCWTAASLLNHKIKHSVSMVLAKKHLNYSCEKKEADVAYSMLRCLKETFLHHIQRPMLPHSSLSAESCTKGVGSAISCTSSKPPGFKIDAEYPSLPKETSDSDGTSESGFMPELQTAKTGLLETVKWIKKKCTKKWRQLLQKHEEENDDLRRKYEEEMASLERMTKAEEAVVRLHSNHMTVSDKLKKLKNEFVEKSNELKLRMDKRQRNLETMQITAQNKILEDRDYWIELVRSWAQAEMIRRPMSQFHCSGGLSCVEPVPSIPVSEATPLPLYHVARPCSAENPETTEPLASKDPGATVLSKTDGGAKVPSEAHEIDGSREDQENVLSVIPHQSDIASVSDEIIPHRESNIVSSSEKITSAILGSEQLPDTTKSSVPDGQVMLAGEECIPGVLENITPVLPPSSQMDGPCVSLSCGSYKEIPLLGIENDPDIVEGGDTSTGFGVEIPPSSEKEVASVSHPCSPTEEIQLVRTGSSSNIFEGGDTNARCGVKVCQRNEMRETVSQVSEIQEDATKEQNAVLEVLGNMAPVVPPSSEKGMPSVSHSCSPTEEVQLLRTGSSPNIFESGDTNARCGVEVCQWNEMRETASQVSLIQEDAPREQNAEVLGNITPVIPPSSQKELHCVSRSNNPNEEIQLVGTESSPDIFEGSHVNTGFVTEVHHQNETREIVSHVSEIQEDAPQEQNLSPSPNAQSASFPCNLGPQPAEHLSQVHDVPNIAEGVSFPSNRVPQNLSSLVSATSEVLAEDASNIEMQTAPQEIQTSVSPAAAGLINFSCRDPEILASVPEEQIQQLVDSESPRIHLQDLPSVSENWPHGEGQTTSQSSQACEELEENLTELPNQDVFSSPTNATFPSGSSSHYAGSTNDTSSQTPLHLSDDPLQNEIERLCKEKEIISKTHEDTRLQLVSDYEKEMEQTRKKYEAKLLETESGFLLRNAELDSNHSMALKNKILAEVIQLHCKDGEAFQVMGMHQVANSRTLQQQVQLSSQLVAPASMLQAFAPAASLQNNLLPTPQPMDQYLQFIQHSSHVSSDAPTRPSYTNNVFVPVGNIPAQRMIRGLPAASLQNNFMPTHQTVHHCLQAMQHSSQISSNYPARPPYINNICLPVGNIPGQTEIRGPPAGRLQNNFMLTPQMNHYYLQSMQCSSQISSDRPARQPYISSVCLPAGNICLPAGNIPARSEVRGPAHHLQPLRSSALHVQSTCSNPPAATPSLFQSNINPFIQGTAQNACQPLGANRHLEPSVYTLDYVREVRNNSVANLNTPNSVLYHGLNPPSLVQQGPGIRRTLPSYPTQPNEAANIVYI